MSGRVYLVRYTVEDGAKVPLEDAIELCWLR